MNIYSSDWYGGDRNKLLKAVVYHEAGHAVVGWYYGKFIRERGISCDASQPGEGNAHLRSEIALPLSIFPEFLWDAAKKNLQAECHISLAGYAAEFFAMRRRGSIFFGDDCDHALKHTLTVMECDRARAVLLLQFFGLEVKKLIRRPRIWSGIELIANALLSSESMTLDSDCANDLLENSGVPRVKHPSRTTLRSGAVTP